MSACGVAAAGERARSEDLGLSDFGPSGLDWLGGSDVVGLSGFGADGEGGASDLHVASDAGVELDRVELASERLLCSRRAASACFLLSEMLFRYILEIIVREMLNYA